MELELIISSKETGGVETRRVTLDQRLTLGRGPESPVVLEGHGLSREHLAIEPAPGGWQVVDLSSNGTWLNGKRLAPGKPTAAGTAGRIEIPGYSIQCSVPVIAAPPAPAPTPATRTKWPTVSAMEMWTGVLALLAFALAAAFWSMA